jgi:transcription antitermination factor NusG
MSLSNTPQWVAVYTASRAEKAVTERISQDLHLETYLPLHRVLRKWSDRMKSVEVPLLPSYTFVKMTERDLYYVYDVQGVTGFVRFPSTGIATIPQFEIDAMRRLAEADKEVYVHNTSLLRKGASVRIVAGHFEGLQGSIIKDCKDGNFAVQISQLNVSLVMTIESDVLEVVPEQTE